MHWSRLFIPTLRDNPAGVDGLGRQLLVRAGYIRSVSPGIYSYMFLAERALEKIIAIVREEMDAIGAQAIRLPVLHPAATALAEIAQGELRSHRRLPQIWHHLQPRFEDPKHSRPDLLRARQSLVSESFSFDLDHSARGVAFNQHRAAFSRIFDRCALNCIVAGTASGAGFFTPSDSPSCSITRCPACGYAADLETATGRATPPVIPDPEGDHSPEPFHTPGQKTIADLAAFTGLPETSQMKSLVLVADGSPVLALVRGDHSLNEWKFARAMHAAEIRPAHAGEIRNWFGAEAGSLGPVGVTNMPIVADQALRGRRNLIAGSNQDDYHLRHVTPGEDFEPAYHDLRQVAPGDACSCGTRLDFIACLELGRLTRLDCPGPESLSMGCYNIYLDRILSAAVELHNDSDGMTLPASIAPFEVVITPVSIADAPLRAASEAVYESCRKMDLDALFDDRDERPGVKFKDADLIGIPYRITIGKKLAEGKVEIVDRRSKKREDVDVPCAAAFVASKVKA